MLADPTRSCAVLIGTHQYAHLEDLPAVENNIERLRQLLTDPGCWGLPVDRCVTLHEPTSSSDVVDAVAEAAKWATDTLIFYFAGHGLTAPRTLDLGLALVKSRTNAPHTMLPFDWVRQAVLGSKASRKVVILDCCYSGRALTGGMAGVAELAEDAEIEGTYLLAAAAETKKALAPPGEPYTAFTGELIHVLENGILNGAEFLDLATIYNCVHSALSRKSRPIPQQRNRNSAARIAFARNKAYAQAAAGHKGTQGSTPRAGSRSLSALCAPVTFKITLERPHGDVDLVLTADVDATVGEVADALLGRDPDRSVPATAGNTLTVISDDPVALDPGFPLSDSGIESGARLTVGPANGNAQRRHAPPIEHPTSRPTAFNRSPVVTPGYPGETLTCRELPETQYHQRNPLLSIFLLSLLGGAIYAFTRNAASLLLVALSPMTMLSNLIEGRWVSARRHRNSMAAVRRELSALDEAAHKAHADEWHARNDEHPRTADCLAAAAQQAPLLWSRRSEGLRFLDVRVGAATLLSRLRFELPRDPGAAPATRALLDEVLARYRSISDVPIVLPLSVHGSIGVVGDASVAQSAARAVICQLTTLHSPAEVVLTAFCEQRSRLAWDWLKWLPHVSSVHSPLTGPHVVAGAESAALLEQLVDLARMRSGQVDGDRLPDWVTVIVLIDGNTTADRARLIELSRTGSAVGIHCIWLASRAENLPAACTAYVNVCSEVSASVGDSLSGVSTSGIIPDLVDSATALAFSRAISPLIDAGATLADLPRAVSWLDITEPRLADDPSAIIQGWQETRSVLTGPYAAPPEARRPRNLRAIVGVATGGLHAVDLRADGPHALVGGTTGSGKSEFLQTWILAMAAAHSPQRVTFLLVDYRGGSAFRECVHLPHTVGLVTDLSPHLVRRALRSLAAELTYREHLFADKHVKDLQELEKTGDPETPPSLVIVVDEFAALIHEVPEFVDGVVHVAKRGRSLGLHLVLATQRPAGVIKDNLRANMNLRLALRMADEADSADVLGSPEAAHFDPALPGRAVSKTGPGRLVPFQAGYVGGWTNADRRDPDVKIEELVIGEGRTWLPPESAARPAHLEQGRTDIARITDSISRATELAQLPPPRRPWLDELAHVYDLAKLPTRRRDDELVFGVIDEPDQQRQSVAAFYPDHEGNLAIFGTGGAGKSTALRSLAIAAGLTARGGPCQVYGLDFSSRGLDMLADLPHVGAVIAADEGDRVRRLMRILLTTADDRARRYAAVRAGTITEYRRLADAPDEPRIIVLLDGFTAFRQQYESVEGGRWYDALANLAADGRPVGIHLIVTADRPASLPPRFSSRVQRRLVLRLADDNDYYMVGAEAGALTSDSPPGRGLLGRAEFQVAVFGGETGSTAQARAISQMAADMRRQQVSDAPRVGQLPQIVRLSELAATADGRPVIGVADDTLAPVGFRPEGVFLISGPPASGRTTAAATAVIALDRVAPGVVPVFFGSQRSPLASLGIWQQIATDPAEVAEAAAKIDQAAADSGEGGQRYAVVIEAVNEFVSTPADAPLAAMIKTLARLGHVVIAEAETTTLGGAWPLLSAVKSGRTGLALQPEQGDGTMVYKTDFPRSRRADYPPGRGLLVEGGRVRLLQVAIPERAGLPEDGISRAPMLAELTAGALSDEWEKRYRPSSGFGRTPGPSSSLSCTSTGRSAP